MDDAKALPRDRGVRPSGWCVVLPFMLGFSRGPVHSQPGPPLLSAASRSEPADMARSGNFQTRIEAASQALRESNPRFPA
jgi:hypothetical protein